MWLLGPLAHCGSKEFRPGFMGNTRPHECPRKLEVRGGTSCPKGPKYPNMEYVVSILRIVKLILGMYPVFGRLDPWSGLQLERRVVR